MVFAQGIHQFSRQRFGSGIKFAVVAVEKIGDQFRKIGNPFTQRWHVQIDDIDAIEQVGTEGSVGDFFFQLTIRGADHAHFDLLVFLGADAAELAILEQLQQLRLQTHVEFGDFIEEQRAAMRHLNSTGLGAEGAGEGSFFIAEKLTLEQGPRNGGTIHLHPRTALPGRRSVNHTGDDIFAGTTLSLNEHRNICAGNFGEPLT